MDEQNEQPVEEQQVPEQVAPPQSAYIPNSALVLKQKEGTAVLKGVEAKEAELQKRQALQEMQKQAIMQQMNNVGIQQNNTFARNEGLSGYNPTSSIPLQGLRI